MYMYSWHDRCGAFSFSRAELITDMHRMCPAVSVGHHKVTSAVEESVSLVSDSMTLACPVSCSLWNERWGTG